MDNDIIFSLISIALLLVLSAFFSGSETGLTAVSRARIYHLAMQNNKRAKIVSKLREQKESLIGAILLGNNLVNILASALATSAAISIWGEVGVAYATVIMTSLVLIFAEVLPKTFAIQRSEQVALMAAPILSVLVKILYPITAAIKTFINLVLKPFGVSLADEGNFISATDILRGTIEMHHRDGNMEKQDRDMLGGVLELEEITVEEIMVHRKNIEALDIEDSPTELLKQATASSHSRLLVYEGDFEKIIGILHVKNLLRLLDSKSWQDITRNDIRKILNKPWYIPYSTSLKNQLYAFRQHRQHLALVVDEYGALQGLVTLEDVIEEIVGEIDDEYDTINLTDIIALRDGVWLVDGDVSIRDLNRHLDWSLPDEEATTIAGLILHEARDIPEVGETVTVANIRLTVEARTANQITRIKIEKLPENNSEHTI